MRRDLFAFFGYHIFWLYKISFFENDDVECVYRVLLTKYCSINNNPKKCWCLIQTSVFVCRVNLLIVCWVKNWAFCWSFNERKWKLYRFCNWIYRSNISDSSEFTGCLSVCTNSHVPEKKRRYQVMHFEMFSYIIHPYLHHSCVILL